MGRDLMEDTEEGYASSQSLVGFVLGISLENNDCGYVLSFLTGITTKNNSLCVD